MRWEGQGSKGQLHLAETVASIAASRTPLWPPSDGDVGVGVSPEREKVQVGSFSLNSYLPTERRSAPTPSAPVRRWDR
jgi:hypothetical protein